MASIPALDSDKTTATIITPAANSPKHLSIFELFSDREKGKPTTSDAANPAVLSKLPITLNVLGV